MAKNSPKCKIMAHLILQRNHNIYHSWKYAVYNKNRIGVVWPGCSLRCKAIRLLWGLLDKQSPDLTSFMLTCMPVLFFFFLFLHKEWKTLCLYRVMAVLLHLKLHHPPHEQFALHFRLRGADHNSILSWLY